MSQFTNPFHLNSLATDEELENIFALFAPNDKNENMALQENSRSKSIHRNGCDNFLKSKEPIINKILINKFRTTHEKPESGKDEVKIQEEDYSEGSFQFKSEDYVCEEKWHNDSQIEGKTRRDEISVAENNDSSSEDSSLELLEWSLKQTKLFETDYLKEYKNLICELNLDTKEATSQMKSKPLTSSILKLELLGNKTFQIAGAKKKENEKVKNKNVLGKIKKAEKLELKENKNPNVFKLVPNRYLTKSREEKFNHFRNCESILFKEYLNEIAEEGFRFNKVFNSLESKSLTQENSGLNVKAEQEWIKYKELNRKFIEFQTKHATEKENNEDFINDNEKLYEAIYKVCISIYCSTIGKRENKEELKSAELDDYYMSKIIKRKALGNCKKKFESVIGSFKIFEKTLNMKYVSLSSGFDCKNQLNELKWKENDPSALAMRNFYDQICEESQSKDTEIKSIPNSKHTEEKLKDYMMNYFKFGTGNVESEDFENKFRMAQTPSTCPLFLQESELDSFILYLNESHEDLKSKIQKSLGSKIPGRMIYQVESRLNEIRFKEQKILRVAYGISTNKNKFKKEEMKYLNKHEDASKNKKDLHNLRRREHEMIEVNEKRKEGPSKNTNFEIFTDISRNSRHREEVDMIRKIKIPSSSKVANDLSNRLSSEDKLHRDDLNKRNSINTSSEVYNNGKRSYFNEGDSVCRQNGQVATNGHFDEKNKRKVGNSRVSETKADLEEYVANLCNKKEQNQKSNKIPSINIKNEELLLSRVESQGYNRKASRSKNMPMSPIGRREHKKIIKYSKYPIEMGGCEFVSDIANSCAILYKIENINLKDIQLRFLRDRRRYSINKVKIVVPLGSIRNQENRKSSEKMENDKFSSENNSSILQKTVKLLQILNCLGAKATVEEHQSYSIPQRIESMQTEISCFMLGQNLQKVWMLFSKFDADQ